jgi:hypothetical protein
VAIEDCDFDTALPIGERSSRGRLLLFHLFNPSERLALAAQSLDSSLLEIGVLAHALISPTRTLFELSNFRFRTLNVTRKRKSNEA